MWFILGQVYGDNLCLTVIILNIMAPHGEDPNPMAPHRLNHCSIQVPIIHTRGMAWELHQSVNSSDIHGKKC